MERERERGKGGGGGRRWSVFEILVGKVRTKLETKERGTLTRSLGTVIFLFSPTHMFINPRSQPGMTSPFPSVNSKGLSLSIEESNCFPVVKIVPA